ncbi:MAG: hypothetical protein KAJ69_06980, partial [Thermoplasmatales archaeon]|nr:hypothetical protein [Thermoplasmatales archaeon]
YSVTVGRKKMKKIFRKSLVCTIIVLFIGFSIVPTISGTINKSYTSSPLGVDPDILWEVEGHTRAPHQLRVGL